MACIALASTLGGGAFLVSRKVTVGGGSLSGGTDAHFGVVLVVAFHLQVWSGFVSLLIIY